MSEREVTGSFTFANVVGAVNDLSPHHVATFSNPSLSAPEAQRQTEREDQQRRQAYQLGKLTQDQQRSARLAHNPRLQH